MSLRIEVECDGPGCCNFMEIECASDNDIQKNGYIVDPVDGELHYCESCWKKIEKEVEDAIND